MLNPDTLVLLVPISLFFSIAWAIKAVADAAARGKMAAMSGSPDLVRAILHTEQENRRMAGLRWGVVLVFLAAGLAIIDAGGWNDLTPGVLAVLIGATGFGNLAAFGAAWTLMRSRSGRDLQPWRAP